MKDESEQTFTDKQRLDFIDAIQNLQIAIEGYKSGSHAQYRIVANQLRLFLLDKENTLLLKLDKNVRLPRIRMALDGLPKELHENVYFVMPGVVSLKPYDFPEFFWDQEKHLSLDEWLDEKIIDQKITIRDFIKSVADKEADHSDAKYNDTLYKAMEVEINGKSVKVSYIISLGSYILECLKNLKFSEAGK